MKKTVLITGSSKGLGECIAEIFASNKCNIILHGRDNRDLNNLKNKLIKLGAEVEIVTGDITLKETIDKLDDISKSKDLDILINNAGIYLKKSIDEISEIEIEKVINTNLIAPIKLIKKIFPLFKQKSSGIIININSMAGKNSSDLESIYCSSKFGLRGFTSSFKFEANRYKIRIIDFYPGAINTNMVQGRKDPEKCINPKEFAKLIYETANYDYESMRIDEIDLGRKIY
jgi:short-subunit dehydrogenase